MATISWEEIEEASEDRRHELHLNGDAISDKLEHNNGELPLPLFDLDALNYLEISDTTLSIIPEDIGKLENLLNLALHRNNIEVIPSGIIHLKKLKFMDISYNNLKLLPETFTLPNLHTLNLGNNQLEALPDFSGLHGLSIVFIDHNELSAFPPGLEKLTNISEIHCGSNNISIFPDNVQSLTNIKHLDLSENSLKEVCCDFSECRKLKTLDLKNNPLKDNRLRKMTLQCSTKAILEYLAKQNPSAGDGSAGGKKKGKGKKGKGSKKMSDDEAEDDSAPKFYVLKADDDHRVDMNTNVKDTRPYLCCAVIKNLDLSEASVFKTFLSLQTKLHETVCDMRVRATIATHNFPDLIFPLTYEALPVSAIEIVPLNKGKCSAAQMIESLKAERDNLKQQKKRQHKTGLYKFIDLVDGKEKLACLRDANGDVVSLPPITNSEKSKISTIISDVFLEITSPMSLPDAKFVMEELIKEMLKAGLKSKCEDESMTGLIIQPVRVYDENGDLKIIYPSKVDLNIANISTIRVE